MNSAKDANARRETAKGTSALSAARLTSSSFCAALDGGRVVVAEILKPRGIRGELSALSQTDIPGRLESLRRAQARLTNGQDVSVELERAWQHKEDWILKFAGIDSIEQAERFKGAELWIPLTQRGELPVGEFFQADLLGLTVLDGDKTLGVVDDIQQYGGPPLLVVIVEGRDVLIPFVPEICNVDLANKLIRANLPQGLLEL